MNDLSSIRPHRRAVLLGIAATATAWRASAASPRVHVWKTVTCGCCGAWVEHLAEAGFDVTFTDLGQSAIEDRKDALGVPRTLRSCHTAEVDGYAVEGHVPARDIELLLTLRPTITGLSVPGMPIGSPGMEMGDRVDRFDTIAFKDGQAVGVFAQHG